ncbi:hypothetical protein R1flu_012577 [Riccia fluitans]|uniref:Uncharacterized protein n=1 Tax=Riccia fluitans TaxID=41844 RepID=A0ABD1ZC14_9MARC
MDKRGKGTTNARLFPRPDAGGSNRHVPTVANHGSNWQPKIRKQPVLALERLVRALEGLGKKDKFLAQTLLNERDARRPVKQVAGKQPYADLDETLAETLG